jgi:hypothetical protein
MESDPVVRTAKEQEQKVRGEREKEEKKECRAI